MPRPPYRRTMTNETPAPDSPTNDVRNQATRRLKAKQELKQFLGIWLGVSLLLVAIWAFTSFSYGSPLYFWPAWPIGGMGVAAFFMGLEAYGPGQRAITEADIDAEVERMNRRAGGL